MTEPPQPVTTPLPVPTGEGERPGIVVLFGGTFDPPHRGHVDLPARVRDELERREGSAGRTWLLYVPAARSPHKSEGPVATDADRVEMLRLALQAAGVARAGVWTDEIDRAREGSDPAGAAPSFTVDTLWRARQWLDAHDMRGVPLRLLIGADQALSFHRWRQPRDILRLARPAVMVRGDVQDAGALERKLEDSGFWRGPEIEVWREAMVPVGKVDVSATQVRALLADRERDPRALRRLVPEPVLEHIDARGLYQGRGR